MSSLDRRAALGLILALGACGYQPAFAPGSAPSGLIDSVRAEPPTDRQEFDFVERIEERLGRTASPRYRLSYTITTREESLGITRDNATTRFNVTGSAGYALKRDDTRETVASGTVDSFTAYAASGTTVATATARTDAYLRLMRILADQVVTDLVATSGDWAPE